MIDNAMLAVMMAAPADHFDSPLAVTRDDRLSHAQKEAVLRAWSATCRAVLDGDGRGLPAGLERTNSQDIAHALERIAELRPD